MFCIETQCGDGINLTRYDRWFVNEQMGEYHIIASSEKSSFILGRYETAAIANGVLSAINNAIGVRDLRYKMPPR